MKGLIGLICAISILVFAILYFLFRYEIENFFDNVFEALLRIGATILGLLAGGAIGWVITWALGINQSGFLHWVIVVITGIAGGIITFRNSGL